jgi:hypothetical protein
MGERETDTRIKLLKRPRHKWKHAIKMNLEEVAYEGWNGYNRL